MNYPLLTITISAMLVAGAACAPAAPPPAALPTPSPTATPVPPTPAPAAPAPQPGVPVGDRVTGTVKSVDANKVTLVEGASFTLNADSRLTKTTPKTTKDLAAGQFVAITGNRQADNTVLATLVGIFSEAFRNPAPGQRPLPGGALMTNATVDKIDGNNMQVSFPGGGANVVLAANVEVIYRDLLAAADLKPGNSVAATVKDGVAQQVQVG